MGRIYIAFLYRFFKRAPESLPKPFLLNITNLPAGFEPRSQAYLRGISAGSDIRPEVLRLGEIHLLRLFEEVSAGIRLEVQERHAADGPVRSVLELS